MTRASRSKGLSEGGLSVVCNMRDLRQSTRLCECHSKLGGGHGDKHETHTRNQSKEQENRRHKTATSRKTKTVRNKRATKGSPLLAPQLITGAQMLYLVWIPEDPSAVAALVPKELRPVARRSVF